MVVSQRLNWWGSTSTFKRTRKEEKGWKNTEVGLWTRATLHNTIKKRKYQEKQKFSFESGKFMELDYFIHERIFWVRWFIWFSCFYDYTWSNSFGALWFLWSFKCGNKFSTENLQYSHSKIVTEVNIFWRLQFLLSFPSET